MKVLNALELEHIVEDLQGFVGSEFQNFVQSGKEFELKHWKGRLLTLRGDMTTLRPLILPFFESPQFPLKPEKKPLTLFFLANVKGALLKKVRMVPELGRVVFLDYDLNGESIEIEIRCIPHGANLIVKTSKKQMSWLKPKILTPREPQNFSHLPVRSLPTLVREWAEHKVMKKAPEKPTSKGTLAHQKDAVITKTEKLLKKLKTQLNERDENPWEETIRLLVANQDSLGDEKLIDARLSYSQNLQLAYQKQARWQEKRESLQQRITELEGELEKIQSETWKPPVAKKITESLGGAAQWRTRHFSEGFIGYIGKSGRDNLKLLRKARAWDYWFHIKDRPGSFGILQRNKNQKIAESVFREMAFWVAEQSYKGKANLKEGLAHEVLMAECRYVRPIKGDNMGRVNYSNARTLLVK